MTPFGFRKKLKKLMGGGSAAAARPAPPPLPRYKIDFETLHGDSYTVEVECGETLVMGSNNGPHPIATGCPDRTCGTCAVIVLEGADQLSPETATEKQVKEDNGVAASMRLSCQVEVLGSGVKVQIQKILGEV